MVGLARSSDISVRDAAVEDAISLAEVAIMAGHGIMTLLYGSLVPGKSIAETIVDRRILNPGSYSALRHWRIAQDADQTVLGALNCFPHHVLAEAKSDPLLSDDRLRPLAGLAELEDLAVGTYYINMVAVFPEHRRSGVGSVLMSEAERLARESGCGALSLCTFEGDAGLLAFYRKHGFVIRDRRPIDCHPAIDFAGNWVLLVRELTD